MVPSEHLWSQGYYSSHTCACIISIGHALQVFSKWDFLFNWTLWRSDVSQMSLHHNLYWICMCPYTHLSEMISQCTLRLSKMYFIMYEIANSSHVLCTIKSLFFIGQRFKLSICPSIVVPPCFFLCKVNTADYANKRRMQIIVDLLNDLMDGTLSATITMHPRGKSRDNLEPPRKWNAATERLNWSINF